MARRGAGGREPQRELEELLSAPPGRPKETPPDRREQCQQRDDQPEVDPAAADRWLSLLEKKGPPGRRS